MQSLLINTTVVIACVFGFTLILFVFGFIFNITFIISYTGCQISMLTLIIGNYLALTSTLM